jgi:TRAP transporter TAXI family solute receptor
VISSGTPGGTYIRLGEQLTRILKANPGPVFGEFESIPSAGTLESIDRLSRGEAQLAFVAGPVLAKNPHPEIRALMALYTDAVHLVVRRQSGIQSLRGLQRKRVFVGSERSGTREIATRILGAIGIEQGDYRRVEAPSFDAATELLLSGQTDAAFFIAAAPAPAVATALEDPCCALLDLGKYVEAMEGAYEGLRPWRIPSHAYSQQDSIRTVGTSAFLAARHDLPVEFVTHALGVVFDFVAELAVAHVRAEDIRLHDAFNDPMLDRVGLHPGAAAFRDAEYGRLSIATGSITGRYYEFGTRLQLALAQQGIRSRVFHTDGSLENLRLIADPKRRVLAIVQYDMALASYWDPSLYHTARVRQEVEFPHIANLRRVAALHEEKVHVLARREKIPERWRSRPSLRVLQGLEVSLGPRESGTQVVARALLDVHAIEPRKTLYLSVPDMLARLQGGTLDAAFFMGHVPNQGMKTAIHDPRNQLVSIEFGKASGLLGPALGASRIEAGTYGSQAEGEVAIDTVSTWAVLVARDDLPTDVRRITDALIRGAAFLGVEGGAEFLARRMPSLPLHEGAEAEYKKAGVLPTPEPVDWLEISWRSLAILVFVSGGLGALITAGRERTMRQFRKRIACVSTSADHPHSVEELRDIGLEARERTHRSAWQMGGLDGARTRDLEQLVARGIETSRQRLKRSLLAELRHLREADPAVRRGRRARFHTARLPAGGHP